jgi:hypothetical protein
MTTDLVAGRKAFSTQLRDAGPLGKLMQARQMVQSVVQATADAS